MFTNQIIRHKDADASWFISADVTREFKDVHIIRDCTGVLSEKDKNHPCLKNIDLVFDFNK